MRYNSLLTIFFMLIFTLAFECQCKPQSNSTLKIKMDIRGKMTPWNQGASVTGKYRNVFLEAGYSQKEIDAKLAKAYADLFEGP